MEEPGLYLTIRTLPWEGRVMCVWSN